MVSIQLLNALINLGIWFVTGILSRVIESIYASISRLQLRLSGKTKATDSSEIDVFQWPLRQFAILFPRRNRNRTEKWVFLLLLLSISILPLELVVETGIRERQNCSVKHNIVKGVIAEPWRGHSDVGIACSALVVERFPWVDSEWDVVFEGSSPNMSASEVHLKERISGNILNRVPMAMNCAVNVTKCQDCGTLTVDKDGGAFDTIISFASLTDDLDVETIDSKCPHYENRKYAPYRGDVTFDSQTGMAFFFWAMPCEPLEPLPQNNSRQVYKIQTRGVEALLSDEEVDRVLAGSNETWQISLAPERTRIYSISCESPGAGWRDLMRATSLYRTIQMEQPGLRRHGVEILDDVPPINSTSVLKALFALKAEDVTSTTPDFRSLPVYERCGDFDWNKAWGLLALLLLTSIICLVLLLYVKMRGTVDAPYNALSWRRVALGASDVRLSFHKGTEEYAEVKWPAVESL